VSDPPLEYSNRLKTHLGVVSANDRLHIQIGKLKLAAVAAGFMLGWLSLARNMLSPYWMLVPGALYLVLAIFHEHIIRARARAETAADYYRRGIARIEDRWPGTGQSGDRFRVDEHVYAEDLDLFGQGGLFELLSTARLPMGENRLADWLCRPSLQTRILERQEFVAELRERLDLRENLAVTGQSLRTRLDPESLMSWAEGDRGLPATVWRGVIVTLAAAAVAAIVYYFVASIIWPLLLILSIEIILRRWLQKRAKDVIDGVACNAEGLILFSNILELLEKETFISPHLRKLCAQLKDRGKPSSHAVRKLARIVYWIDAQHSLLAGLVEVPLLYTMQVGFAAEAWRSHCGRSMRTWVDIAAEMEALLSLATYSFEHPTDPFPEFSNMENSSALFSGEELGHPLIPASNCVRNDVHLDRDVEALMVSGSNMSGKSTLLRVVGINAVLAMAGAPIRGKSLRLTPLTIGTRIRSTDSLREGRSGFYTEIMHIRRVFELTAVHGPLLFLFDELLEGTNSKDRRIGAEALIRTLLSRRAIGIVTTHDLALTEITSAIGGHMRNMHFEDQIQDGKMRFDYKLREGIVTRSNAIELMRLIGFEM
jgi:hypothetical protein